MKKNEKGRLLRRPFRFHLRVSPLLRAGLRIENTRPTGRVSACGLEFDEDDQQGEKHE